MGVSSRVVYSIDGGLIKHVSKKSIKLDRGFSVDNFVILSKIIDGIVFSITHDKQSGDMIGFSYVDKKLSTVMYAIVGDDGKDIPTMYDILTTINSVKSRYELGEGSMPNNEGSIPMIRSNGTITNIDHTSYNMNSSVKSSVYYIRYYSISSMYMGRKSYDHGSLYDSWKLIIKPYNT